MNVQVWWVGVVVPLGKEPLVGVLPLFGLCCILDTQSCLVLRPCDGDKRRVCACVCVRACVHVLQIPQCPGGCGGRDVYGLHPAGQITQIEHSVSPYPSSFLSRGGRAGRAGRARKGSRKQKRDRPRNAMHNMLQEHATVGRIPTVTNWSCSSIYSCFSWFWSSICL